MLPEESSSSTASTRSVESVFSSRCDSCAFAATAKNRAQRPVHTQCMTNPARSRGMEHNQYLLMHLTYCNTSIFTGQSLIPAKQQLNSVQCSGTQRGSAPHSVSPTAPPAMENVSKELGFPGLADSCKIPNNAASDDLEFRHPCAYAIRLSLMGFYPLLASLLALLLGFVAPVAAEEPPFLLPPRQKLTTLRSAEFTTTKGKFLVELFPDEAPWHVANLKYLADKGFYRGSAFHIYEPGYIIQGGGPASSSGGGPGYTLPAEFSHLRNELGTLGMARQPNEVNPERRSHGSQFHILLTEAPHMNGAYTVFGKVVRGMEAVEALRRGDRITDVRVFIRK
ncbi:MAG: peptidylprolyl isomerase [Proteobacteria bacterium]|nr:peptidylprolyl isomerase [Pseudomonadota bacterium]